MASSRSCRLKTGYQVGRVPKHPGHDVHVEGDHQAGLLGEGRLEGAHHVANVPDGALDLPVAVGVADLAVLQTRPDIRSPPRDLGLHLDYRRLLISLHDDTVVTHANGIEVVDNLLGNPGILGNALALQRVRPDRVTHRLLHD